MTSVGKTIRCVLVGDEDVGKTSLLITYLTNRFPEIYVPTILDSSAVNVKIKNKTYTLGLFDTSTALTQDYLKTDVFLLCFSFDKPLSLQNIEEIWLPMLQMNNPKAKIVLVGLKSDLKNFMNNLIMSKHAEDIAEKLNFFKYLECSAKTQKGVKIVFNEAILAYLNESSENTNHYINTLQKIPQFNGNTNTFYKIFLFIEILLKFNWDIINRILTLLIQNGKEAFMEGIVKTSESFKNNLRRFLK